MDSPRDAQRTEALMRIATAAAELMILYPDASIAACLEAAAAEDLILHGSPDADPPKGWIKA